MSPAQLDNAAGLHQVLSGQTELVERGVVPAIADCVFWQGDSPEIIYYGAVWSPQIGVVDDWSLDVGSRVMQLFWEFGEEGKCCSRQFAGWCCSKTMMKRWWGQTRCCLFSDAWSSSIFLED